MNLKDSTAMINALYGSPMGVMSDCIRGMLIAEEGHELIACDFSAIEARGLAWLADEEKRLEIFRGDGKIYEYTAGKIFGVPPEEIGKHDPRRQIGKVAELALGYGGGVGAFQTMASGYNVKCTDAEAEKIKNAWRNENPAIVGYWKDLEEAAKDALDNPGIIVKAGAVGREVKYKFHNSFLVCLLPSGRPLFYPYARLDDFVWGTTKEKKKRKLLLSKAMAEPGFKIESDASKGITYMYEDSVTHQWSRGGTYGGSLSENITQAVCRDLLAEAIVRLEKASFPVVLHAHDEVVVEVPAINAGAIKIVEKIMCEIPTWAKDFPISAAGWVGARYRK